MNNHPSLTPHGPGFKFIDSIEFSSGETSAVATKYLEPSLPFFADHFPGNPMMPGVLLIEAAAQASGCLWGRMQGANTQIPFNLAQVVDFRFRLPALPGQVLKIKVTLDKDFGNLARFRAIIHHNDSPISQGTLTLARINISHGSDGSGLSQ